MGRKVPDEAILQAEAEQERLRENISLNVELIAEAERRIERSRPIPAEPPPQIRS